ncbi:MAG: chromosomal replication initiator protein DnaA [Planctomycetota bacterium]
MSVQIAEQWRSILDRIQSRVSPGAFVTFSNYTTLEAFSGEEMVIGVGSAFIKEWLRDHHLPELRAVVQDLFQLSPKIQFRVAPKPFQKLREAQEAADLPPHPADPSLTARDRGAPSAPPSREPPLRADFRLDRFVIGSANRIAFHASLRVVESDAVEFNPLLIYGASGLGKTHLLQGICHAARDTGRRRSVLFLSGETFVNEFLRAVERRSREAFRNRFRSMDLLVVDDIQILAQGNKAATQEEFLHTFDGLQHRGSQIVLSCNTDPRRIEGLAPRLAKRFVSGLALELDLPDPAMRQAIVRQKASERSLNLSEEIVALAAQSDGACVRELEGFVSRLAGLARFGGIEITPDVARHALGPREEAAARSAPRRTIEAVAGAVSEAFGVLPEELTGARRSRRFREARAAAMLLAQELTGASLSEIGAHFGGRSHATVHSAIKNARSAVLMNSTMGHRIRLIRAVF